MATLTVQVPRQTFEDAMKLADLLSCPLALLVDVGLRTTVDITAAAIESGALERELASLGEAP